MCVGLMLLLSLCSMERANENDDDDQLRPWHRAQPQPKKTHKTSVTACNYRPLWISKPTFNVYRNLRVVCTPLSSLPAKYSWLKNKNKNEEKKRMEKVLKSYKDVESGFHNTFSLSYTYIVCLPYLYEQHTSVSMRRLWASACVHASLLPNSRTKSATDAVHGTLCSNTMYTVCFFNWLLDLIIPSICCVNGTVYSYGRIFNFFCLYVQCASYIFIYKYTAQTKH